MRAVVLLVRFLSELAALAALAVVGVDLADGAISIVLAMALPLVAALLWGRYVAPASPGRLHDPARGVVEVVIFGCAVVGLAGTGHRVLAITLGIAAACTAPLARRFEPAKPAAR